jgi:histone H3/H4
VVKAVELGQGTDDAVEVAKHAARRPPIRESVDAEELVQQFRAGRMIKELVADYSISESSVKRLLRSHGAGRRN